MTIREALDNMKTDIEWAISDSTGMIGIDRDKNDRIVDRAITALAKLIEDEVIGGDYKITLAKSKTTGNRYIKASDMPKYYRNTLKAHQRNNLKRILGE